MNESFRKSLKKPRRLVVLVPGAASHSREWASLRKRLEQEDGYRDNAEAHWFPFDHKVIVWAPGHLEELATRLRSLIDQEWAEYEDKEDEKYKGFEDVVLIGHSVGGLIARRAYLMATGAVPGQKASPWSNSVSRIVLFASANRGVDLDRIWWARPIAWFERALPLPHLFGEDVVKGSNFLTNLRIDWIRYFHALEVAQQEGATESVAPSQHIPLIVQFLGDHDGLVTGEDSKDILAFPNGTYQPVADATHGNLFRLDRAPDPDARYALLRQAFVPSPPNSSPTVSTDPVKRVVFLLHGIRASNTDDWVEQLETRLKDRDPVRIKVVPPTYGYFTALRFALPSVRKKNIPVFQDDYTEQLAQHPGAEFDIIAHSNGTYMLGYSLDRTPGMRFTNVVLVGSPLPQDYPWVERMRKTPLNPPQIGRVMNERANHDWVIAILCSVLRGFRMRDVGLGGFAGFLGDNTIEVAYHVGGHGKALEPENRERLINFVLGGDVPSPTNLVDGPGLCRQLSNAAPYVAWAIIISALAVIARLSLGTGVLNLQPIIWSLIILGFIWFLADVV